MTPLQPSEAQPSTSQATGSLPLAPPRRAWRRLILVAAVLLVGVLAAAAGWFLWFKPDDVTGPSDDDGPVWFTDVTEAVGLDFVHDAGQPGSYFMPQSAGSGGAFIHDADGSLYIYLLQNGGPEGKKNQLFKKQADGTFRDVSQGCGLNIAGYNMGVAVGDVNNDGLPDVVVTQYDGIKLFLNLGGGRFQDVTQKAGLENPVWGASAAFFDYNRDGWLDLVVANYVEYDPKTDCKSAKGEKEFCGPQHLPGRCSKLFRNCGKVEAFAGLAVPGVRFEDVSFASGIGQLAGPGLGVVCADFNGDGWPDVFIANDGKPNRLWINQKNGTFKEEAASRGIATTVMGAAYAGMGVACGDVAGSGMLDLFVTHLGTETHTLWRQGPNRGQFRDTTRASGLLASQWRGTGFGTLMADFDLDGSLDIAVVNGRVLRGGDAAFTVLGFWEPYAERNQLFANDGTGKFRDLSPANKPFCGRWNVGRGLACADFDNDGAPDLLVIAIGGRARLFKNVAPQRGHWLQVRALDPALGNRDAYGAEVRVRAGGRQWLRVINPAQSYLCSNTPLALFGLGTVDRVDAIEVTWPDGSPPQTFEGGAVDRVLVLRKREAAVP
jgi:enediyne biosynthesis protein E4